MSTIQLASAPVGQCCPRKPTALLKGRFPNALRSQPHAAGRYSLGSIPWPVLKRRRTRPCGPISSSWHCPMQSLWNTDSGYLPPVRLDFISLIFCLSFAASFFVRSLALILANLVHSLISSVALNPPYLSEVAKSSIHVTPCSSSCWCFLPNGPWVAALKGSHDRLAMDEDTFASG